MKCRLLIVVVCILLVGSCAHIRIAGVRPGAGQRFYYSETDFLNYEVVGKGPITLLFLHGFGASLRTWDDVLACIPGDRFTSYLIDLIGLKRIGDILLWYCFYMPENGGGIWLGARYPPGGERYPEPIKGLSHAANVMQICRFYYMLANSEIISPERSRQMLEQLRTVYPEQWTKLLDMADDIRAFIRANDSSLKTKS